MSEWRDAKRFLAKLLAFAMVLGNVFNGSVVAVAAERGESATAVFTMTGEDLQNAVESAKESGSPVSFDDMGLSGSETLLAEYRKVLGEGEVYQIQAGYTTESVNEAELTLYYNAGSDELIFFYENNDIVPVSFRTVVDGYATEAVSVRPYESEVATTSNAAYFLPDIVPEYESDVITEDADTEMQEEDIQETDILRARDESFREIAAATGSDAETETGEETESESGRKTKESAETEGSKSTEPESEIEINGTISGRRLGTVVVGECANAAAYIANYSALLKQLGMDISGAYEETVSLDDGSEILVKVPADAFDEKVEFCAVPIKTEAEITALKGTVTKAWDKDQRVTDLRAFDLSFCNEAGEEAVPSVPVEVTITLPARLNTEITPSETIQEVVKEIGIQVYHVPQAGGAEPVMSSSDSAQTVFTFETASFSPFVVLASAKVESVIDFDQVRTFDQLKAAIENVPVAEATSSDAARITVVESFDITGKIEIPKKKKILLTSPASSSNALKRAETYKGDLFDVSGELTLTNITLDGNREKVTAADGSLVEVKKSGKLNIQDGAILRNNETRSSVYRTEVAGAVNNAGTMSMTGGSIEYNSAAFGSGVYNTGNFTFSGGEI